MLDQDDRQELATFFARRLTPELQARPEDAPVDIDGWIARLEERPLRPLAKQIRETCPEDANLQAACRLLESMERRTVGSPIWLGLAGVTAAALAFMTLGNPSAPADAAPRPAAMVQADIVKPPATKEVVTPTGTAQSEPNKPVEKLAAQPVAVPRVQPKTNDSPPSPSKTAFTPQPKVNASVPSPGTDAATPTLASAAEAAEPGLRCAELPEGAVGYWYAGVDSPGATGDTLTIDEWINVRKELPTYKNDWSARTAIQCVLRPGDRLTLSTEPRFVPRDSYWVAIVADDIVEAG